MQTYKCLTPFFLPTGTAETESTIIDAAYVTNDELLHIINPPPASPCVLVGKKGSGKSIVLRFIRNRLKEASVPAILLRPSDLDSTSLPRDGSLGALIRYYKDEIVASIAVHIGRDLKGYLSDENEIVLSKIAKDAKARRGDWYEQFLDFVLPIGAGVTKVDYAKLAGSIGATGPEGLQQAIQGNLGAQEKFFYLLFDDTDQVADSSDPHHLNRIWAFVLALRQLMEKCPNIRCIVTLRAEIWIRLKRDNASQRDQVDHIRGLIVELSPTEDDVLEIAKRRLALARDYGKLPSNVDVASLFFEGTVSLPGMDETRSWYDFLVKRSRERPRDLVQLVAKLVGVADRDRAKPGRITDNHAALVVIPFSRERVEDLKSEVEKECSDIEAVIRTFAQARFDVAGFSMTAQSLTNHLMRVPSVASFSLYGKVLKPMDEDSAFALWRYLFDIGFLGARYADANRKKGFTHRSVHDDSSLVSKGRRHELEQIHWDINPAYRDFLDDIRATQFLGLPNLGAKSRGKRE